jgi:hypothetical protein
MKSKTMLIRSLIMMTVLMVGLICPPLVTKTYADNYNGYNDYAGDMPYNSYGDYNKVEIFPPSGQLTVEWWKWILDIPSEINPLLDETGENCDVGQEGRVWFLVGTPGNTEDQELPITGSAERECTIPEGKKILFPIFNTFCSELNDEAAIREALDIPPGQPIPASQLEEGLRLCAEGIINSANILEASIDGKEITNVQDFRVQSPLFTITYPEDNPFGVTNFTGIPQKAVSDGYWVLVKGLEPGEHIIEFRGGIAGQFETETTYHITIEPSNNNYYDNNYGSYNNGYSNNNYYY